MTIFKSTRNLISFILIAFYVLICITNTFLCTTTFLGFINAISSLIPILFLLCYFLLENKNFKIKKYIFPLSFGIIVFRNLYNVTLSFIGTPKELQLTDYVKILFAFTVFLLLFNILCFVGTLFEFKYLIFMKIGCIGYILTIISMQVYEFISLGGMEYINSIPKEITPISFVALAKFLSIIAFYLGVLIANLKIQASKDE